MSRDESEQRAFDHLCANGKLFTGIKRPNGFRQMKRKECFRNSQRLAIDGRATYVEGLCLGNSGIAFAHGWLTLDGEHAIDVTLPDAESYAYFGLTFDAVALAKAICTSGYYESQIGLSSVMACPPQLAAARHDRLFAEYAEALASDTASCAEVRARPLLSARSLPEVNRKTKVAFTGSL